MLKEAQKFAPYQLRAQQTDENQKRAREIKIQKDYEEWRAQQAHRKLDEARDNAADMTSKKISPQRDFGKAAGKPPVPQRTGSDEQDERRNERYSAFRDLARDITRDHDRDRSKEIKPPGRGKPPGGPPKPPTGPKGPKT